MLIRHQGAYFFVCALWACAEIKLEKLIKKIEYYNQMHECIDLNIKKELRNNWLYILTVCINNDILRWRSMLKT